METTPTGITLAACREGLGDDDGPYRFYLVNERDDVVSSIELDEVEFEWGDESRYARPETCIGNLLQGASVLVFRDDGEFRVTLKLTLSIDARSWHVEFEYPKLYRQKNWPHHAAFGRNCILGVARWTAAAAK